jgi:hypothetical protein
MPGSGESNYAGNNASFIEKEQSGNYLILIPTTNISSLAGFEMLAFKIYGELRLSPNIRFFQIQALYEKATIKRW